MTGAVFVQHVQVKLNRLDTNSYQDVRPEEVLFFAKDALKSLTLDFDLGLYSNKIDDEAINVYLSSLIKHQTEVDSTGNEYVLPATILKIKDLETFVTIGTETGWKNTRELTNEKTSSREDDPFSQSFPDTPVYRLIDNKIKFDVNNFTCTKVRFDYLQMPEDITEVTELSFPFMRELEDKTVTLILENLEARRLQSQPPVSKS